MTVVHIIEAFWGAVLLAEDQESLSWASDGFPGQVMYQSDGFREETTKAFLDWELSCSDLKSCWCFGRRVTSLVCGATQR